MQAVAKKSDFQRMASELAKAKLPEEDKAKSLEMIQKYDGFERLRKWYPHVVAMVGQDKMVGVLEILSDFSVDGVRHPLKLQFGCP